MSFLCFLIVTVIALIDEGINKKAIIIILHLNVMETVAKLVTLEYLFIVILHFAFLYMKPQLVSNQ